MKCMRETCDLYINTRVEVNSLPCLFYYLAVKLQPSFHTLVLKDTTRHSWLQILKEKMHRFVLFDIDGTLINPGGAGRRSLTRAFYEIFSIHEAFVGQRMAGKTDIQIIKEGLARYGLPIGDEILSSVLSRYVEILQREIPNSKGHINPGVADLLDALKETDGCWLGLLTGNIERGARIKLGAFSLNGYFPVGAFGDDMEDRNRLLPIAVEKLRTMAGIDIGYGDCIVVGDTPLDVMCSRPFGARSIAVATGPYRYESLLETGADYVLRDLSCAIDIIKDV
jgi:phosphoglycolate phosphatase